MLKIQCLILAVAFNWQAAGAASLIHHWALDGDATDSAGAVDGAVQNGAAYATGQFGQAISLDGVDQSISMGAVTIVPTTDYTLTAWVLWEQQSRLYRRRAKFGIRGRSLHHG